MSNLPIVDSFGRVHTSLRVGVTDRCNLRCVYCMPENVKFLPQRSVLTFEEIKRLVEILAALGVDRIRITGGEPLVRAEIWKLVSMIRSIDGIQEIALTTNGLLLADQAENLKRSGLDRINVSLDTIDPEVYQRITRRDQLDNVLTGISVAKSVGFENIRLNAVAVSGTTESEIVPLAKFSREQDMHLRFIEFMPLDADEAWQDGQVLSGSRIREILEAEIELLEPTNRPHPSQPAVDFRYADGRGSVGFINSVTQPFCGSCDRMRITAEGKMRNCLFSCEEWDIREAMRAGATNAELERVMRECISAKKSGHGTDDGQFVRPEKAMYQIGG